MKLSEELSFQSQTEENDIKSFALQVKALREKRSERFIEDWLPLLSLRYTITKRDNGSYSITTEKYGIIDYYPKSNNMLIRRTNKWIKPALSWIIKNLTN